MPGSSMSFNDLNISKKFAVGFAAVVTIVTVMSVAVFLNLRSIKAAVADNDLEVHELNYVHDVQLQIIERQNGVRGFAITGDKSFLKAVDEALAKYHADIAGWSKEAPEDAAHVQSIKAEVDSIFAEQDHQVAMAADPATHEAALIDLGRKGRLNKIRAMIKDYEKTEGEALKQRQAAQASAQNQGAWTLIIGGALSVLLSALMGWLLSRAIATP
ncbi:MAG: CHASE3 domain-containing protein, partial [Proteobacteria bacterium]|nr:CHASE3 domain-containing protein [Pseudomonadota bacterium]